MNPVNTKLDDIKLEPGQKSPFLVVLTVLFGKTLSLEQGVQ